MEVYFMDKFKRNFCLFLAKIKKAKVESFSAFAALFLSFAAVGSVFAAGESTVTQPEWGTIISGITANLNSMLTSALPPLFGIFAIFLGVRIVRRLISRFTRV